MEYSRYSANPVGRLVLLVCGYRDEERALLSDKVCTALQLANFWQDVVEDWERGRRYLPADAMARFGVTDEQIAERRFTPEFRAMMKFLVEDARSDAARGWAIAAMVDRELAVTLRLFEQGGEAILDGIAAQGYDVLARRPSVSKAKKVRLLAGRWLGKALQACLSPGGPRRVRRPSRAAYAFCREIARREAKNFYYAFRVLPKAKSDAMCAVYAFMRQADDISDDESKTLEAAAGGDGGVACRVASGKRRRGDGGSGVCRAERYAAAVRRYG